MKQAFAIFTKDARHFWPEIFASIAVTLALVVVYPHKWGDASQPTAAFGVGRSIFTGEGGALGFLAGCLIVLVPITWWILITRVVHGERLVGNTQFWLTRPYEWQKFLAAKILFIAVFLSLPFFVAQCLLLVEGGFNPFLYLPGLFYNLLLVTGAFVLPLAALSVVTSGFARMTLVVLGVILFIAGVALAGSLLPSDTTGGVAGPLGDKLSFIILVCGCFAAVLVQYARRRLRTAWLLIALVALSLSALAFIDPDQALMGRYYPPLAANVLPPAEILYAPTDLSKAVTNETRDKSELEIAIPLRESGVAPGYAVIPVAVKAGIEVPNGARWESPWNAIYNEHYLPGTSDAIVRFRIRRALYDRFKASPVNLRLTFAIDQARSEATASIPLTSREFAVTKFGICTPQSSWFNSPLEITGISCRSAMHSPQLTYVTAQWTEGSCSEHGANGESFLGATWQGSFETDPAEFGTTSVWETPLNLSNSWAGYNKGYVRPRQLCPGSPVTFTRYELVGHTQIAIEIPGFQLPELALGDQYRLPMK